MDVSFFLALMFSFRETKTHLAHPWGCFVKPIVYIHLYLAAAFFISPVFAGALLHIWAWPSLVVKWNCVTPLAGLCIVHLVWIRAWDNPNRDTQVTFKCHTVCWKPKFLWAKGKNKQQIWKLKTTVNIKLLLFHVNRPWCGNTVHCYLNLTHIKPTSCEHL